MKKAMTWLSVRQENIRPMAVPAAEKSTSPK